MYGRRNVITSSFKKVSAKQLNKMITTYRKNNKNVFQDIMTLAEAQGIKLKSGSLENEKWVSSSKRKTKQVQKLYEQIVTKYGGSYTQYKKRLYRRYQQYKNELEPGVTPISFNEYDTFMDMRREIAAEIYSLSYAIDYGKGDEVEESTTVYDFATDKIKAGDEKSAIFDLMERLEKLQNQAERYGIDYNKFDYSRIRF